MAPKAAHVSTSIEKEGYRSNVGQHSIYSVSIQQRCVGPCNSCSHLWKHSNSGLPTEIVDIFLFTQLINVYEQRQDDYEVAVKDLQWLHGWGQLLASGDVKDIGGLYNSNRNYWVSILIDVSQCCYLHRDSLSSKSDDRLAKAIKWWTHYHT